MSALKNWEIENAVRLVDPARDSLYRYDEAASKSIQAASPWKADPNHFKHVRISANALIKMTMHAREGGSIEVMGLMLGYVQHETFVVTDAMRLPVEGTETRVNAGAEADEYMVQYLLQARESGRLENPVGWYHSHPGYGCWLSGIDVDTQASYQSLGPFVAVVIDPDRTIGAGKVEIGAFRTYPQGFKPEKAALAGGGATIPEAKAQDFGAHADRYYPLEVSHFKSALETRLLEALWNKYWVQTISASPLSTNRDYGTRQIQDVAEKINRMRQATDQRTDIGPMSMSRQKVVGNATQQLVRSAERIANEERIGLMAALVKEKLFNCSHSHGHHEPSSSLSASQDVQMVDAKGT